MQKEYILCRYSGLVDELTPYTPKNLKWAHHAVRVHNAHVMASGGDPGQEFYFLNEKIKSRSVIISLNNRNEFVKDDPAVIVKLENYLQRPAYRGNANSRKIDEDYNKTR